LWRGFCNEQSATTSPLFLVALADF